MHTAIFMARKDSVIRAAILLWLIAVPLSAQIQESAVAGDSTRFRRAFVKNQLFFSAAMYAPLIASLGPDERSQNVLYVLGLGASAAISVNLAKEIHPTRVQNDMATDGTIRGLAAGLGIAHMLADRTADHRVYTGVGLAGAVTGSVIAFQYGARLTPIEAQAARSASTLAAAAVVGALGSIGLVDDSTGERAAAGAAVAGAAVGYLIGPQYPRRARYGVTRGDVPFLTIGALMGVGAGITPVAGQQAQALWSFGTAGMMVGIVAMDRFCIRRHDHAGNDATLVALGALAAAATGYGASQELDESKVESRTAIWVGSGILGALWAHTLTAPRQPSAATPGQSEASTNRWRLIPENLAFVAARMPGSYPVLRVSF
jgi:hypothetical protein